MCKIFELCLENVHYRDWKFRLEILRNYESFAKSLKRGFLLNVLIIQSVVENLSSWGNLCSIMFVGKVLKVSLRLGWWWNYGYLKAISKEV